MTAGALLPEPGSGGAAGGGEAVPVSVRCVRPGAGTDPLVVLLLHGLASNATIWRAFASLAEPGCEIWTADLPWRGTGVPGWETEPVESWIGQAVSAVPGGPDVVVAHSFATNALLAWLDGQDATGVRRPAAPGRRLRGVILVAPLYKARAADFDWQSMFYYLDNVDRILAEGLRATARRALSAEREQAVASKVRELIGPHGWIRFLDTYLRTPSFRTDRMLMPFLIVSGKADVVAFPSDALALGDALPCAAVHILPGLGHFPMLAPGHAFTPVANQFLRACLTRPEKERTS